MVPVLAGRSHPPTAPISTRCLATTPASPPKETEASSPKTEEVIRSPPGKPGRPAAPPGPKERSRRALAARAIRPCRRSALAPPGAEGLPRIPYGPRLAAGSPTPAGGARGPRARGVELSAAESGPLPPRPAAEPRVRAAAARRGSCYGDAQSAAAGAGVLPASPQRGTLDGSRLVHWYVRTMQYCIDTHNSEIFVSDNTWSLLLGPLLAPRRGSCADGPPERRKIIHNELQQLYCVRL